MLHLPLSLISTLRTAAACPVEVCGLIGGRVDGHTYRADHLISVPNIHPHPEIAYEMARREMVAAVWVFRRAGRDVVALYHSHPYSAPTPSESDIALATWPDAVYLIIGHAAGEVPELGGWLIRAGSVQAVPIHITGEK